MSENYPPTNHGPSHNGHQPVNQVAAPEQPDKTKAIIGTLSKIAPFLLIGGAILALILFFTGNHIVVYEANNGGKCGFDGCTRTRLSFPMIAAIVAIVDGISFTIFGQLQKAQEKAKLNK